MDFYFKEKNIETKCVKYAKDKGWVVIKLYPINNKGAPDRVFFKNKTCFFVEFKKPGGILRKIQAIFIDKLASQGFPCYIIDNYNYFKKKLSNIEKNIK